MNQGLLQRAATVSGATAAEDEYSEYSARSAQPKLPPKASGAPSQPQPSKPKPNQPPPSDRSLYSDDASAYSDEDELKSAPPLSSVRQSATPLSSARQSATPMSSARQSATPMSRSFSPILQPQASDRSLHTEDDAPSARAARSARSARPAKERSGGGGGDAQRSAGSAHSSADSAYSAAANSDKRADTKGAKSTASLGGSRTASQEQSHAASAAPVSADSQRQGSARTSASYYSGADAYSEYGYSDNGGDGGGGTGAGAGSKGGASKAAERGDAKAKAREDDDASYSASEYSYEGGGGKGSDRSYSGSKGGASKAAERGDAKAKAREGDDASFSASEYSYYEGGGGKGSDRSYSGSKGGASKAAARGDSKAKAREDDDASYSASEYSYEGGDGKGSDRSYSGSKGGTVKAAERGDAKVKAREDDDASYSASEYSYYEGGGGKGSDRSYSGYSYDPYSGYDAPPPPEQRSGSAGGAKSRSMGGGGEKAVPVGGDQAAEYSGDGYDGYSQYSADAYSGYSNYSGGAGGSRNDGEGYDGYSDAYSKYDDDAYGYDYGDDDKYEAKYDDDVLSEGGISGGSYLSRESGDDDDVLGSTAPRSKSIPGPGGASGAAAAAAAARALPRVEEEDGTLVGLGIQLQEPTGGSSLAGFVVTKLIRGAPGDKCGLILEGDVLTSVDGRSISALRFSEVSAMLAGPEGVPISLQFERPTRDGGTRSYDVALRRERFYLGENLNEDEEDEGSDDASEVSGLSAAGGKGSKRSYWEGYRAAMAHKAPPLASGIGDFESDEDDDDDDDDLTARSGGLPGLPRSPLASDFSDDGTEIEMTTEQQLTGALAAGATVGLPSTSLLEPLPTAAELDETQQAEAAAEAEQLRALSGTARRWAERMGSWDATLKRDLEGLTVKSELLGMWRLKLTRVRAKLGIEKGAVRAQEEQLVRAKLPQARASEGPHSTAEVLRVVKEGGREATAELLTELQRQMVEAERWRAETKRMGVQLKRAREEMSKRTKEMSTMRAQNVTWSTDNKQRRQLLQQAQHDSEELRSTNAAVVAQASTLEERVAKLQDEVMLKSELAAMWRRSAERGSGGGGSEAEAAALTWKIEAEKALRESERWKALARRSEEALRSKDDEALHLRASLAEAKLSVERRKLTEEYRHADETPLAEVQQALLAAQDDLSAKAEEASQLSAKVARLEKALRQLM